MSINSTTAANAYRNQMKMMEGNDPSSAQDAGESPFASLLKNTLGNAVAGEAKSEALQTEAIAGGKVELTNIVTAVANAELTLNTIVAVRDRVINAYNDIIKMGI